ncbi:MAG: thioredoxin family protein [Myxococcales bacterium]|nr:thioredoxin family protein [Myxococcales bacterium]
MKIELLYFEGCPAREPTRSNIDAELAALGIAATVSEVDVESDDAARSLGFPGSPTVRVNGQDIEAQARPQAAGRRCRLYVSQSGVVESVPDRALIRDALLGRPRPAQVAVHGSTQPKACCADSGSGAQRDVRVQLLTASWCPRCPQARRFWRDVRDRMREDGRELRLEEVDVESAAGRQLVEEHGIRAVPTTLIDGELVRIDSDADRAAARHRVEGKCADPTSLRQATFHPR